MFRIFVALVLCVSVALSENISASKGVIHPAARGEDDRFFEPRIFGGGRNGGQLWGRALRSPSYQDMMSRSLRSYNDMFSRALRSSEIPYDEMMSRALRSYSPYEMMSRSLRSKTFADMMSRTLRSRSFNDMMSRTLRSGYEDMFSRSLRSGSGSSYADMMSRALRSNADDVDADANEISSHLDA